MSRHQDPPKKNRATAFILSKLHADPNFMKLPPEIRREYEERASFTGYDLSEDEIPKFEKWMSDNNNSYWDAMSYDPIVAFKQRVEKAADGHSGDIGKKPFHPTFSDESIYHAPNYNNKGPYTPGGAWANSPTRNWYFLPSSTNMRYAQGYREPTTGRTGIRGRMDSQGDFLTRIVKYPDSKYKWDQEAADQENAFVRDMTGMDFDNPKNNRMHLSDDEIRKGIAIEKRRYEETDKLRDEQHKMFRGERKEPLKITQKYKQGGTMRKIRKFQGGSGDEGISAVKPTLNAANTERALRYIHANPQAAARETAANDAQGEADFANWANQIQERMGPNYKLDRDYVRGTIYYNPKTKQTVSVDQGFRTLDRMRAKTQYADTFKRYLSSVNIPWSGSWATKAQKAFYTDYPMKKGTIYDSYDELPEAKVPMYLDSSRFQDGQNAWKVAQSRKSRFKHGGVLYRK